MSEDKLFPLLKERFECHRCNRCCEQPGSVYLKPGEPEKIAAHLNQTPFEFINQFCDLQNRKQLVLKKKANDSCIFLDAQGCQIHDAKPFQCQDFPIRWRSEKSLDYCEGLKALSDFF